MCHFLPQGLKVEAVDFCHENGKGHVDKSITINLNPISNPMGIETVEDFRDLFIITNVFVVEKYPSRLFKVMHDLNGDITSSDSRAF